MKTGFALRKAGLLWLLLGFSISAVTATRGAGIGLTITPDVLTNNYTHNMAIAIANLTAGMTVNVDVYADLNSNGIIDAGDLLIGKFQVTDGQVPLVAGVRNLNVPGDEDGLTNGQIQTVLHFPSVGSGFPLGQGLLRVSDPAGSLISATQTFSISQKFYPQGVAGQLTWAGTGLPLTNGIVALMPAVGTTPVFTVADTNGNYQFYCVPGSYAVGVLNNNGAIYSLATIPIGCGQMFNNNLVVTNGTFYLSGRVTDSGTGLGVPAVSVNASSPNNLGVLGFTDTNGNYALLVTPNTWSVHPNTGDAAEAGYADPTRTIVTITSAGVSGINFALSKPTALIYGTIKDTLGNPVVGVQVSTHDPGNNFSPVGRSFATDGSYSIGVLAGTWNNVVPNSADLAAQGLTSTSSNVTLAAGQTANINFAVTRTSWPTLSNPIHVSSSQFQFLLSGLAGQSYTIQTTTNLGSTNWTALLTTDIPCATVYVVDTQATNGQRFYRALVVP